MIPELVGTGVIVDHIIGTIPFDVKRDLARFPGGEFLRGPASGLGDAVFPEVPWAINEDEGVALGIESDFEEQRAVFDDGFDVGVAGVVGAELPAFGVNARVNEGFESGALYGVVEDDPADGFSVHRTIGVDNGPAPPGAELLSDVGVLEGFSGDPVGVDDAAALFSEDGGDQALARAGSAHQSDDGFEVLG